MAITSFLSWWYSRGLVDFGRRLMDRLRGVASFFSMGALARTLFAPFRQISAGEAEGVSMQARMQAFFDRLFSRMIGAVVRLVLMVMGLVVLIVGAVVSIVLMVVWLMMPIIPVVCGVLAVMGVTL